MAHIFMCLWGEMGGLRGAGEEGFSGQGKGCVREEGEEVGREEMGGSG